MEEVGSDSAGKKPTATATVSDVAASTSTAPPPQPARVVRRSGGCIRNFIKESTRIKLREFILNRSPHLKDEHVNEPIYPTPRPQLQQQQPQPQQQQQQKQQLQPIAPNINMAPQPAAAMNNFSDLEAAIKQLESERRLQYEMAMRQFEQELMRQIHENRIKMSDLGRLYEFYLMRAGMTASRPPPPPPPTTGDPAAAAASRNP